MGYVSLREPWICALGSRELAQGTWEGRQVKYYNLARHVNFPGFYLHAIMASEQTAASALGFRPRPRPGPESGTEDPRGLFEEGERDA